MNPYVTFPEIRDTDNSRFALRYCFLWCRASLILIAAVLVLCGVAVAIYDLTYFSSKRSEMRSLLADADPENRNPPAVIMRLIDMEHENGPPIEVSVARGLRSRLDAASQGKRMLHWHVNSALWTLLVRLHIPKNELYGYYCTFVYNGQDFGLNELAQRLFAKPLSQLSEQEAASVVVLIRHPSRFLKHEDEWFKYRDRLLERFQATQND